MIVGLSYKLSVRKTVSENLQFPQTPSMPNTSLSSCPAFLWSLYDFLILIFKPLAMITDTRVIPMHMVKIILGFFRNKLTDQEHDELDEWICATDDNMLVFEEMLEIMLPLIPDHAYDGWVYSHQVTQKVTTIY